jgi:DNA-binding protein HU-beta
MNKLELAQIIAKEVKLSQSQAMSTIDVLTTAIKKAMKKGDDVVLIGFGSFKTKKRAARVGVNPQTGAKLKIPARKVVKFVVGKSLKTAV